MCEVESVLIAAVLLLAADFCIYQANSEKKVGHNIHLKIESPCKKEYRGYCLNGG